MTKRAAPSAALGSTGRDAERPEVLAQPGTAAVSPSSDPEWSARGSVATAVSAGDAAADSRAQWASTGFAGGRGDADLPWVVEPTVDATRANAAIGTSSETVDTAVTPGPAVIAAQTGRGDARSGLASAAGTPAGRDRQASLWRFALARVLGFLASAPTPVRFLLRSHRFPPPRRLAGWFDRRDPFHTTRWRLLAWMVLFSALVLGGTGTYVYVTVSHTRVEELDRQLQAAAHEAGEHAGTWIWRGRDQQASTPVIVVPLDARGRPKQAGSAAMPDGLPNAASARLALSGIPNARRVVLNGIPFRVLTVPVTIVGLPVGAVQVAAPLAAQEHDLAELRLVLLVGSLVGLAAAAAAGVVLVELAIVPAQRAFLRQREFVADASHELRTPVALIGATSDLLASSVERAPAERRELAGDLQRESAHLGRMIADLLDLARLDSGQLHAESEPVPLHDVVEETVEQVARLELARDLRIDTGLLPSVWVMGDLVRLRQVLLILLDNAVKHTPAGGQIHVRLGHERGAARLDVTDSGSGIAPEHLPRLFERFYRVDAARARAAGGVGLGLAIARDLVELHGGRIGVASQPGCGSTFTVWLPLASYR